MDDRCLQIDLFVLHFLWLMMNENLVNQDPSHQITVKPLITGAAMKL